MLLRRSVNKMDGEPIRDLMRQSAVDLGLHGPAGAALSAVKTQISMATIVTRSTGLSSDPARFERVRSAAEGTPRRSHDDHLECLDQRVSTGRSGSRISSMSKGFQRYAGEESRMAS
jgi:hypothetical protein